MLVGGAPVYRPIRYFVVNEKTQVMHICGLCNQSRKRDIPIRLFDTPQELQEYAGRTLTLCNICARKNRQIK